MLKIQWKYLAAFIIAIIIGMGLRYLYEFFPNPVVAMFAPVNGSAWELVKIVFWPFLAAALIMSFAAGGNKKSSNCWAANFASAVLTSIVMLVIYYFLTGAFGAGGMIFQVIGYVLIMALGFYIAYKLCDSHLVGDRLYFFAFLAVVMVFCIVIFTFMPPNMPMFVDSNNVNTLSTIPY